MTDKIPDKEKEAGSFRLIATLGIAGFLSGIILVGVYLYTKPFIAENKAKALEKAVFEVLPGTVRFEPYYWTGNELAKASGQEDLIFFGYDQADKLTGVAIPGEASGYQDIIAALAGYNPDQKVIIGLKVLESKETPGLGDKILLDADFKNNFKALAVVPDIEVVKKGEKKNPNQMEAITGATISSKTIGQLLRNSMNLWKERIENHLNKNHGNK